MKKLLILASSAIFLQSCTANNRARNWGGSETINLETNERLINVTWKEHDLWILVKNDTTTPTSYSFKEKSSFGVMQGTITIIEH